MRESVGIIGTGWVGSSVAAEVLTAVMTEASGLPPSQVIGTMLPPGARHRPALPTIVDATGAVHVVEPEMSAGERARLHSSADVSRKAILS